MIPRWLCPTTPNSVPKPRATHICMGDQQQSYGRRKGIPDKAPRKPISKTPTLRTLRNREKRAAYWAERGREIPKL